MMFVVEISDISIGKRGTIRTSGVKFCQIGRCREAGASKVLTLVLDLALEQVARS